MVFCFGGAVSQVRYCATTEGEPQERGKPDAAGYAIMHPCKEAELLVPPGDMVSTMLSVGGFGPT